MINDVELKPCHACGSEPIRWWLRYGLAELDLDTEYAYCDNPDCWMYQRNLPVEKWNVRPIEDALRARAEKAEAVVSQTWKVLTDINTWCGTDDGYHALPFEPPWYQDLRAAVIACAATLGTATLKGGEG